ncbi:MAG: hypothetical protein V3V11_05140 [Vicinamibacteria bacterium]
MILQFGALFSSLVSGIGAVARAALPGALDLGKSFLNRELNRKAIKAEERRQRAAAVAALNSPGIAVTRLGGTRQPVGGAVQRSTFTPAPLTPAQSPFGNIPLLPVGGAIPSLLPRAPVPVFPGPFAGFGQMIIPPRMVPMTNGLRVAGAVGEPKFAKDEMGKTIMFVPSPRPGEGFLSVQQARAMNLSAMKPWWRFNRLEGQFEKISPRRMNPFNFRAAKRAGRRIERTLEAIKGVVVIQRKMEKGISAGGKIVKFKTGGRKRKKA